MKKRILSIMLVIGMLFSCVTVVNASAFTQNSQAQMFNTFNGWEKTGTASDTGDTIDGWEDSTSVVNNKKFATNRYGTQSKIDSATQNVYASTMANTSLVHLFDEVVKTGILHLSFDMANKGTNDSDVFVVQTLMNTGNNITEYPLNAAGTDADTNQILNVRSSKVMVGGKDVSGANSYMDGNFHKYDIIYDFNEAEYGIYADGELLGGKKEFVHGLKGFNLWDAKGTDANDLIDNIALYHYPTGISGVEMAADCGKGGALGAEGGKVNVAFSEYIANYTPAVADFKVTNSASGDVAVVKSATKAATGVVLEFDALSAGEYEISFVNNSVKGAISEKNITGKATFMVNATGISQTGEDRYLLSEGFERYNGGMPAGWAPTLTTQTVANENANLEKISSNTGNGLKIKGQGDIFFEFPNPIASTDSDTSSFSTTMAENWEEEKACLEVELAQL